MQMTPAKKRQTERQSFVRLAYKELTKEDTVTLEVKKWSTKFRVTEQTIWNDLKPVINEKKQEKLNNPLTSIK